MCCNRIVVQSWKKFDGVFMINNDKKKVKINIQYFNFTYLYFCNIVWENLNKIMINRKKKKDILKIQLI